MLRKGFEMWPRWCAWPGAFALLSGVAAARALPSHHRCFSRWVTQVPGVYLCTFARESRYFNRGLIFVLMQLLCLREERVREL